MLSKILKEKEPNTFCPKYYLTFLGRKTVSIFVRFEVFTAVTMKNAIFWDMTPCTSCMNRRFGGMYRLHLQGRKIRERGTSLSRWLHSAQLVGRSLPKRRTTQTQNNHMHIPNIHALCGIRTHNPGFWASEDSTCLRPLGYRDRLLRPCEMWMLNEDFKNSIW
jgi:hypothetical protein